MSEYQYYEFRAIDRALTEREMDELGEYSSRAEITPTSFTNEYNYGDFRGDERKFMEKYFDAFVYLANWGSRRLILRLPQKLFDAAAAKPYIRDEGLEMWTKPGFVFLQFAVDEEEPDGWEEGEGWMGRRGRTVTRGMPRLAGHIARCGERRMAIAADGGPAEPFEHRAAAAVSGAVARANTRQQEQRSG